MDLIKFFRNQSLLHALLEVTLREHCCDETKAWYETLDKEPKERMLEGIMNVFHRNTINFLGYTMNEDHTQVEFPVLQDVARISRICPSTIHWHELGIALGRWGRRLPRDDQLSWHSAELKKQESRSSWCASGIYPEDNYIPLSVSSDFCKLEKVFIQDLKLFEKSVGKYIEGIIITKPLVRMGITTFLEDARGDIIQLCLYNMVPNGAGKFAIAENKFPVGLKIKIAQPYYKIFPDGNLGIRVDTPVELCVAGPVSSTFDEIVEKGRNFSKLKDYLGAYDIYFAGFEDFPDVPLLLSNRSQAELKMGQFELALLDSAAVLFIDGGNEKARLRYKAAAKELGYRLGDPTKVNGLWTRVLSYNRKSSMEKRGGSYTRKDGNTFYKEGNYSEAKSIYTAVLSGFEKVCKLLTGLGFTSLKTDMYQTAISAASACLQISTDEKHRRQARRIMTTAFSRLGELELAKLSAMNDPSLSHLHDSSNDSYNVVLRELQKAFVSSDVNKINQNVKVPSDYVESDAIEHCYILGKGRGLKAKQRIFKGVLLIIDHPVTQEPEQQPNSHNPDWVHWDTDSRSFSKVPSVFANLESKIIALVKYDGLLAKKLLLLYAGDSSTIESPLPLIPDLEMMAYRKLSHDLLPFLPQTPAEVGIDTDKLTPAFIRNVVKVNVFEWRLESDKGCALTLVISLFNHDENPNCCQIRIGNTCTIIAIKDIQKGEELTIEYSKEKNDLENWDCAASTR